MTNPYTSSASGVDRFAQYRLVPSAVQEAPIEHDYSADSARDETYAKHLRGLQNLAAQAQEARTFADAAQAQHAGPPSTPLAAALERALRAATRDATADGVAAEGIERAIALGRTGVHWHQQPADPALGRFEKMRAALAASETEIDAMRAQLDRVPEFVADAWRRTVAEDLAHRSATSGPELQPSRATGIDATQAAEHGSSHTQSPIGSAITDAMLDGRGPAAWTNESSPPDRGSGSGISSQGAEL
ncbi:hypothetical protein IU450_36045 [Nocardia abscessus]|uniref:hypothetical protein n=1 Tax=Nocardia abscessus TaxID=120957 RepID=UPI001895DF92|nr:hypothetical protein [Nocardia abscessus]MBF6341254.1 hypothetical protein [Nocardia abscessus]